jgi:molecular chaperone DnaK
MSDDEKGSGADRRRFPRTALSLLVQYRFNSFEDFLAEYSVNISPGGMFIRTDNPLEEGSMVYLQFSLKDGSRLIEGMGRVVRANPPGIKDRVAGMGVEFVSFDDESMALINEICAQREAGRSRN